MRLQSSKQSLSLARKEEGVFMIFTVLSISVVIFMVGWALDSGNLFHSRHRLQRAVDAGAITGIYLTRQLIDNPALVDRRVKEIVNANLSLYNISPQSVDIRTFIDGFSELKVSASYPEELYLVGPYIGKKRQKVSAHATARRGSVALVLVMDFSGSMGYSWGGGTTKLGSLKDSAWTLVQNFQSQYDQLALIGYSNGAWVIKDIDQEMTQTELRNIIFDAGLNANGATNLADALDHAYMQVLRVDDNQELRKVVMVLSDGQPNMSRVRLINGPTNSSGEEVTNSTMFGDFDYYYDPYVHIKGTMNTLSLSPAPPDVPANNNPNGLVMGCRTQGGCFNLSDTVNFPAAMDYHDYRPLNGAQPYSYEYSDGLWDWDDAVDFSSRASITASDNIRRNLGVAVVTVGIGDTSGANPEALVLERLLKRVANDAPAGMADAPYAACENNPLCDAVPHYDELDSTMPVGKYYYAGDPAQLQAVFDEIEKKIYGYRLVR